MGEEAEEEEEEEGIKRGEKRQEEVKNRRERRRRRKEKEGWMDGPHRLVPFFFLFWVSLVFSQCLGFSNFEAFQGSVKGYLGRNKQSLS